MSLSIRPYVDISVPEGAYERDVPLAAVERGRHVESLHRGTVSVALPDGTEILALGDTAQRTYLRSAAKPFQAMALVVSGAADALDLSDRELAVACSSHSGQEEHVDTVVSLLQKADVTPDHLQCGIHRPLHEPTAEALARDGTAVTVLHNNCSGKHAGMLVTAAYMGWPLSNYRDPGNPLQRLILRIICAFTDQPEERVDMAIDGCGAPVFYIPVRALAIAFARLVSGAGVPPEFAEAAHRIRAAMMTHPFLVGGSGRFDTEIMQAGGGRIASKGGAQGGQGIGLIEQEIGIGLKISDGSARPIPCVSFHVMDALQALDDDLRGALAHFDEPPVLNHAGLAVGRIRATFAVEGVVR